MRSLLRRTMALAVVSSLAVTACGPFHRGSQPESVVVFHNQSGDQADVYAIGSGGQPIRVGTVFAQRTETLRLPLSVTGAADRVNIIARIFASGRIVASGPFSISPGESMDVTLVPEQNMLAVLPSRTQ
jgi:hypothetical protein